MNRIIKYVAVLSIALGLHAGDPGAFEIDFYDAGVPPWLEKDKILNRLQSKKIWLGVASHQEEKGRYITRVFKDSPAKKSDIRVGDIITNKNWDAIFEHKQPNDIVELSILRDTKQIEKKVKVGLRDPLVDMLNKIKGDDHHWDNGHRKLHNLSLKNRDIVYQKAFLKNRAFDCKNAHKKLSVKMLPNSKFTGSGAQVIFIRGSHRVMFINKGRYTKTGAHTICINSADYDGKNLTEKKVTKLYWKLFGDQIDYWYENP